MQRGVGQVQRRLKSLIIASNALAQRAPRRATKKKQEVNERKAQKPKYYGKKCKNAQRSAVKYVAGDGGERVAALVGGAIKKRVSSSPKLAQRNAAAAATPPRVAMNDLQ